MYDFDLTPPDSASVEISDFGRDVNGNPTANYLVMFSNGKTGAEYAGDSLRSKRRTQTGYYDKFSEGALEALCDRFAGTRWKIKPDSVEGDRCGGRVAFEAMRDFEAEPVPVLFRMEGDSPVAFFPTLPGTNDPWTVTSYARLGQHCSASKDYYRDTRPATDQQAEQLRKEIESIGYVLAVVKRWTARFDELRFATLNEKWGA